MKRAEVPGLWFQVKGVGEVNGTEDLSRFLQSKTLEEKSKNVWTGRKMVQKKYSEEIKPLTKI